MAAILILAKAVGVCEWRHGNGLVAAKTIPLIVVMMGKAFHFGECREIYYDHILEY